MHDYWYRSYVKIIVKPETQYKKLTEAELVGINSMTG